MDRKHKQILRDHLIPLARETRNFEKILDILLYRKVLNSYMISYIKKSGKGPQIAFYELIQGRGPTAFEELERALRDTDNKHILEILNMCTTMEYPNLDITDTTNEELHVSECNYFMDIEEDNKPNGVYRMRSKPRGRAIIINIEEFDNHRIERRLGSEKDVEKLNRLFKGLGYNVDIYKNLAKQAFEEKILELANGDILNDVDSSIMFIMSHGEQHDRGNKSVNIITRDCLHINSQWIIDKFLRLAGRTSRMEIRKPKLFFFQACRGFDLDMGPLNLLPIENPNRTLKTDSINFKKEHRSIEDALVVFSTIPGHTSIRSSESGSWFVNAFCKILSKNACRYDLDTMLGQVDEEVRKCSSQFGYQTTDVNKIGFTKKLFFNPGLFEESGNHSSR